MSKIDVEIWDSTGSKKNIVELPTDVPISRLIVVLVEKLSYPKFDPTGGMLLSYKMHHRPTGKQLLDSNTLEQCAVQNNDVIRLIPEITAGSM
jgi:hypothetical protein